jgi:hypothetical protein
MIKKKLGASLLILGLMILSCESKNSYLIIATETVDSTSTTLVPNTSNEQSVEKKITGTSTAKPPKNITMEITKGTSLETEFSKLPDLLINYGPDIRDPLSGVYLCGRKPQIFLLFSEFPYSLFSYIPDTSKYDQNFPSWSINGKKIAYIESDPEPFYLLDSNSNYKKGFDRIIVMDTNGDVIQVSNQSFDRSDFDTYQNLCEAKSLIYSEPVWSFNGENLIFSYVDRGEEFKHQLYLYNLTTNQSKLILDNTANWGKPIWFVDQNKFVDFDNEGLIVVSIESDGLFSMEHYPWPYDNNGDQKIFFTFIQENPIQFEGEYYNVAGAVTIFDIKNQEMFFNSESIWKFNIDLQMWEKIESLDQRIKNPIIFDENYLVGCSDKDQLLIHKIQTQNYTQKLLPENNHINCNTFHIFQDDSGKKGVSFWVNGDQGGLWVSNPNGNNIEIIRFISQEGLPDISKETPEEMYIESFSFMNVIDYTWRPNNNSR